jgi:histidinol phosphatase-like PHP family hydrolase
VLVDLHSHSMLSDGTLSIDAMVAAAERRGYEAYAVTDHATGTDPGYGDIATAVRDAVDRLRAYTSMRLFAGVELTDFEPARIAPAADEVRRHGAQVVVVHGECVSMGVLPGTNAAAVRSPGVDILAHPGLVTQEDAQEAARHGVYLELSARQGHNWANGHVYRAALMAGAPVIVDSDAHEETGLLSLLKVAALVRGAGAPEAYLQRIQGQLAPALVRRVLCRPAAALT